MFVNDGSKDSTWKIIKNIANKNEHFVGINLSRSRGHQNALLAGLMEAKNFCDITISIDCDGQDDVNAIEQMIDEYKRGAEIVYGVRKKRKTDSFIKRITAETYYKLLRLMGAEIVLNHADYRLVSSRVLKEFAEFREVNLFLRGIFPLIGFKTSNVYYDRKERIAGKSKYTLGKMLLLAWEGITSLSITPIKMIIRTGMLTTIISSIMYAKSLVDRWQGNTIGEGTSIINAIYFVSGCHLICIGIIGEYIGKIYMEVKQRPRYIISERTDDK